MMEEEGREGEGKEKERDREREGREKGWNPTL